MCCRSSASRRIPRDATSAFRVLQLLDGVGPAHAKRAIDASRRGISSISKPGRHFAARRPRRGQWPAFVELLLDSRPNDLPLPEQVAEVRKFYAPILEKRYDQAPIRKRDIEQLEQIAANFHLAQRRC